MGMSIISQWEVRIFGQCKVSMNGQGEVSTVGHGVVSITGQGEVSMIHNSCLLELSWIRYLMRINLKELKLFDLSDRSVYVSTHILKSAVLGRKAQI